MLVLYMVDFGFIFGINDPLAKPEVKGVTFNIDVIPSSVPHTTVPGL